MSGLAPSLPLIRNSADGFANIKNFDQLIKQNLKMLLLTNPGERVMDPNYGVGMRQFLFENFDQTVYARIDSKIREQASVYMRGLTINDIGFNTVNIDQGQLGIRISYSYTGLNIRNILEFTISGL